MGKLSRWAVCSLAFGILSFLAFPLIPIAIITGLVALYKIRCSSGALKGTPFAIAGIAVGSIAIIFAVFIITNYEMHYRAFKIPAASMLPTIKPKERIMVDMKAYNAKYPVRGDIIVYELLAKGKRRLMCKRIAGLPGEEIEIRSGKVYINGAPTEIPGLPKDAAYLNDGEFGRIGQPVKIPDGFYYVLGDNPSASFDSRQHGPLDRKDIKGKYVFCYKSLKDIMR